jgi:ABC-type Mn2+/Zn2+ transport system ATPase subunit
VGDPLLCYSARRCAPHDDVLTTVRARDVWVRYPGVDAWALAGVSLEAAPGARVALVGPNGSGKSTLLKVLAGLLRPDSGVVEILGHDPRTCRHDLAYMPQRGELDWSFPITVRRLALAGRYPHVGWLRRPGRADREIVDEELTRAGLAGMADRRIERLSGGQRQRLLLARALAQRARVLLLDEPEAALDAEARELIWTVLDDARRRGITAIVATHAIDGLESRFDRVMRLSEGRATTDEGAFAGPIGGG